MTTRSSRFPTLPNKNRAAVVHDEDCSYHPHEAWPPVPSDLDNSLVNHLLEILGSNHRRGHDRNRPRYYNELLPGERQDFMQAEVDDRISAARNVPP